MDNKPTTRPSDLTKYMANPPRKQEIVCEVCEMKMQGGKTYTKHIIDGTCTRRRLEQERLRDEAE
ncbi:hypothetical protein IW150_006686 [Coemansia sp. RSA 2607]|nr:hypothetical protein IW150_006686 [Coemansia sp. RSA 2607]KAJ2390199.1 hypothetical protein GGI05_003280 [Coemansia sp. RSA 2603]